ncbi:MAG: hypothetical protein OEV00_08675 [Acidobacteriota bacterium]|nr:hypothetical protein [Acidobacteriota bacterium]MDH3785384.1 hypothetical protein [Acidobacteriota bacterium]
MRKLAYLIMVTLAAVSTSATFADARQDVRVHSEKDSRGNLIYTVTNDADKQIKTTLRHVKTCSSTTTTKKPIERDYWLQPGSSRQLRKVMPNSDCRHRFQVVRAEYN